MKWLLIETAPKDGTVVIVGSDCHPVQPSTAIWVNDPAASACAPGWFINYESKTMLGDSVAFLPLDYEPTHWMQRPPLPGSEPSQHNQAKAIMDEMTDEERLSLMQEYCVNCGTKHTPCYCTRDD